MLYIKAKGKALYSGNIETVTYNFYKLRHVVTMASTESLVVHLIFGVQYFINGTYIFRVLLLLLG